MLREREHSTESVAGMESPVSVVVVVERWGNKTLSGNSQQNTAWAAGCGALVRPIAKDAERRRRDGGRN